MNLDFSNVSTILFNNQQVGSIDINGVEAWRSQVLTPFYVENISDGYEILSIVKDDEDAPTLTIEYSLDGVSWYSLGTTSTTPLTMNIPTGSKRYLRCVTDRWARWTVNPGGGGTTTLHYNTIRGVSKICGNIMSLIYGGNYISECETFSSIGNLAMVFNDNTDLVDASELILPATTLSNSCYRGLFKGCTALSEPPILPATVLYHDCYYEMFYGCTSLTKAPELLADTLVESCYMRMFNGCTALTEVKCLASTITGILSWLYNVSSIGTFYKKAGVSWPSGASGIPTNWTVIEV